MTRFEQLQWAAIYILAHAAVIVVAVEGLKIGAKSFFEAPMSKKARVMFPLLLGATSFFVCPLVVHMMSAGDLICLGQEIESEFCVNQIMRASVIWWITVSLGSLGLFSVFQLVKMELVKALIGRIKKIGGDS